MKSKDFYKKYDEIRIKYDILILAELINLYKEYKRNEIDSKIIFNELHDYINYSKQQEKYIINQAEELSKIKND